jgi:hypothetical protein
MQMKKSFKKRCQIFAAHVEEAARAKVTNIEDHPVLRDFEDVFVEISVFSLKRDINFSIDFVLGVSQVSKTPYRMGTPELKEL